MSELPEHPSPLQVEVHFLNLLDEEGFDQPDEVLRPDPNEVVFVWHEPKVAIVVEIGPDGPVDVRPQDGMLRPPV